MTTKHISEDNPLRALLQEAISGPSTPPGWSDPGPLTAEGLRRAIEAVQQDSFEPYDGWPGSRLNPVHPAVYEAAREWHGLPPGAVVTQQQLWEWMVGVPRT